MKNLNYLPVLMLLLFTGCKKSDAPGLSYDETNRILRVRITSKNDQPFDVSVNRISADASINLTVVQTSIANGSSQAESKPFELAYTPAVGTTINLNIQSKEDLLTAFIFYKGAETYKVYMQKQADGLFHGTFSYKVIN